jgi:hypothetical protein
MTATYFGKHFDKALSASSPFMDEMCFKSRVKKREGGGYWRMSGDVRVVYSPKARAQISGDLVRSGLTYRWKVVPSYQIVNGERVKQVYLVEVIAVHR